MRFNSINPTTGRKKEILCLILSANAYSNARKRLHVFYPCTSKDINQAEPFQQYS